MGLVAGAVLRIMAGLMASGLFMLCDMHGGRSDTAIPGSWSSAAKISTSARQFFVAPDGRSENTGARQSPWDLRSALAGERGIGAGDILWVRGGAYRGRLEVLLTGREGLPVIVRGFPGERATLIDSTLAVMPPSSYLWMWDLEITSSAPADTRVTRQSGSFPTGLPGGDGLNVHAGKECKFIDLIVHGNVGNGVGWWIDSTDSEFYGCVIYDNGWRGPDRGHGHCIYTQNRDGMKTIANCILSAAYDGSYTVHAYGTSRAFVDNYRVEDNIVYERGPFLIGGGRPSHGIHVLRNCLYGVDMRIGYGAENEDCELRDNVIAGGRLTIEKYRTVLETGTVKELPAARTVLIPNRYDPARAHVAIYNGAKLAVVKLTAAPFLKRGQRFRLYSPHDLYGAPLLRGVCQGATVALPTHGAEFAAYVLIRE